MRRLAAAVLCLLLLAPCAFALTALDAAGGYTFENGGYVPLYTEDEPLFSEGLAAVCSDGRWGYANADGKLVIEPAYDAAGRFSYGLAPVSKDGKNFYIDVTGEKAIDASDYDEIFPFVNGYARVRTNGLTGFLNARGDVAVAPLYADALDVSENMIAACLDEKWGYLSAAGKTLVPFEFDYAESFSGGVAYAEKDGVGLLINTAGSALAEGVCSALCDGLALKQEDGGWGFVDAAGETVLECVWQDVELPAEGFVGVSVEGKWGFADYSGEIVIEPEWDFVWPFSGGYAMVGTLSSDLQTVGEYRFIDRLGHVIGNASFRDARPFSGGYAAVSDGSRWGYIDGTGKLVIDYLYDFAAGFDADAEQALAGRDGLFYIIAPDGAQVSFYTADAPSLLTTAAQTSTASGQADTPSFDSRDVISAIVLSVSAALILFVIVAASMRAYHLHKAKKSGRRTHSGRYYDDE